MSDPTLSDVIERLDRLEVALNKLVDLVSAAGAAAMAPAPAYTGTPRPTPAHMAPPVAQGPPPIKVAPPNRPPAGDSRESTARPGEESTRDYDPYSDRVDIVVPGPEAGIHDVLARVFEGALMEDAEETWALMSKLTHSSQLRGPRALDHFKAFAWHKLRRTAATYLNPARDPRSFVISYTEPGDLTPDTQRVKVFVQTPDGRLPAPISFARDPDDRNAWRVTMVSL